MSETRTMSVRVPEGVWKQIHAIRASDGPRHPALSGVGRVTTSAVLRAALVVGLQALARGHHEPPGAP